MSPSRFLAADRKRKLDTTDDDEGPSRVKKSPLADLPQNHYAPPVPMTKEELSAWRKEQRRERNRQSAADSRNKTKLRIEELEGEVLKYKTLYEDMKKTMEGMERQIRMLTEMNERKVQESRLSPSLVEQETVTPPQSYPSSPSRSPVLGVEPSPHDSTIFHCPVVPSLSRPCTPPSHPRPHSFFPPVLSSPADCAPDQVSSHPTSAATAASLKDHVTLMHPSEQSKVHLIKPISRQAVKITGATALDSPVEGVACSSKVAAVCSARQPVDMTVRDSVAEGQMFEDEIQGGDAVPVFEGAVEEVAFEGVVYGEAEGPIFEVQSALDGDEDLLDLLVETLDGDFDPNLLV